MEKQLTGNDRPLHLAKENDKTILASSIGGVEIRFSLPKKNLREMQKRLA